MTAGDDGLPRNCELKDWTRNRAEAGRLPPKGFPKSNRFEG
jgi:topoisomerase IV subunit A